jgi:hypothetical protein
MGNVWPIGIIGRNICPIGILAYWHERKEHFCQIGMKERNMFGLLSTNKEYVLPLDIKEFRRTMKGNRQNSRALNRYSFHNFLKHYAECLAIFYLVTLEEMGTE